MKKLILSTGLFALIFSAQSQRIFPVLDNDDTFPFQPLNGVVHAFGGWDDKLVVGGSFDSFHDGNYHNIILWDGEHASALGEGWNAGDETDHVTAIRRFFPLGLSAAGRLAAQNVVRIYNGTEWSQLGESLPGGIFALEVYDNQLFASGSFGILFFDGSSWITPFSESVGDVRNMIAYDDNLYFFGTAASNPIFGAWNGTELTQLESPLVSIPRSFYADTDQLYVCGHFNDGTTETGLAEIDGYDITFSDLPAPYGAYAMTKLNADLYFLDIEEDANVLYMNDEVLREFGDHTTSYISTTHISTFEGEIYFSAKGVATNTYDGTDFLSDGFFTVDVVDEVTHLHGNNVNALMDPGGVFFRDRAWPGENYEVPFGSGVSTIWSSSLWASGIADGAMFAATDTYGTDDTDGWPYGPIADVVDQEYTQRYYHTWNIKKSDVEAHMAHFSDPGYEMPFDIATWPGNGDVGNGESFILAPFHDVDGDNYYEPWAGDYPDVPGDEAVYSIFNDQRAVHTDPSFQPMDIEVHAIAYAYAGQPEPINSTVFMHCVVINRSENDYDDFRLGVFSDWDIGNSTDDFVGCDSLGNLFYGYNGDDMDEEISLSPGYGEGPPAQGCLFLNRDMAVHTYYNIGTHPVWGDPISVEHFANYMRGKFKNGADTFDGPFMFSDSPCEVAEDNELGQGNVKGDRRGMGSTGSFTMNAGAFTCFDYAYVYFRDSTQTNFENACSLVDIAPNVKEFYDAQINSCDLNTMIIEEAVSENAFAVYPNPGKDLITITANHVSSVAYVKVADALGKEIMSRNFPRGGSVVNFSLDTSSLSGGVYFIEFISDKHRSVLKWIRE